MNAQMIFIIVKISKNITFFFTKILKIKKVLNWIYEI
jgi:hypothetical protein